MAATPEEFLGQQESFLAEPFSPCVFLDLPPTPRPDGDGDGDGEDPAMPDDLVLPYISRMLMEEDMEEKYFYHHPALLQAQERFAEILCDATATDYSYSSSDAAAGTSGSDSAISNGSGTFTSSASSSSASAFTDATWPYDPAELTQQLLLTAGDANAFSSAGQDGSSRGFRFHHQTASDPDKDTEMDAKNRVDMDMLNLAFLKGVEEAKKFLPSTDNILLMADTCSSSSREHLFLPRDPAHVCSAGQAKKNKHKHKHKWDWDDDDLEAEAETAGRKSKLMVPDPGETGEVVDKMITEGYIICQRNLEGLRITMGSDNNNRKGRNESSSSSHVAVDLSTLLLHCAQAVSMDDRRSAAELLRQIKQHSSPRGDGRQRLAHCFAEGLEARLAGRGSQLYRSLVAKRTSVVEYLKAYHLYLAACCFVMTAFRFSNLTIGKVAAGRKKLHIVDYGAQYGCQWPILLDWLAKREGGPPEVRMTCIDPPEPGFRPSARLEETGRRLTKFARQRGLPFKFRSVTAKWETVCAADLDLDPDEALVVNSIIRFEKLMDESTTGDVYSRSPRDVVLGNIRGMRPDAFILCVANGLHSSPFFMTRFREALSYYSAVFDMLDATAPRDNEQRLVVERDLIGQSALNVIACEGADRVERPETYKQWQTRNQRAGLRQLPPDPDVVETLREKVKNNYHREFMFDVDHQWLLQGWKGRTLYAMSTWVAQDEF